MNPQNRVRELEDHVRDLERRNRDLQNDIRTLSTRGDDLQTENANLKIKVRELESQIDTLRREVSTLKRKIEDLEDLRDNFEKYVLQLDWTIAAPPSCLEYLFDFRLDSLISAGLGTRYVGKTIRKKPNGMGTYETEDYIMEGSFVNGQPHGSFVVHDKKRELRGNVIFKHGTQEGIFDWTSAVDTHSFVHRGMSVDNKTEGPSFMVKKNGDLEFSLFEDGMLDGESVTIDATLKSVVLQKWSMNKKSGLPIFFYRSDGFSSNVPQMNSGNAEYGWKSTLPEPNRDGYNCETDHTYPSLVYLTSQAQLDSLMTITPATTDIDSGQMLKLESQLDSHQDLQTQPDLEPPVYESAHLRVMEAEKPESPPISVEDPSPRRQNEPQQMGEDDEPQLLMN